MLATIQKVLIVTVGASAFLWSARFIADESYALAACGALLFPFAYVLILGVEFVLLRLVNRQDSTLQASTNQLVRAWLAESELGFRVFAWWQPFRSNAVADRIDCDAIVRGRRGVVLIHGFFCNRGFWTPWLKRLECGGHAFAAVNLEPAFGSIDGYSSQIGQAVLAVTKASGLPPLIVCHSMGGLAVRAWLKTESSGSRVYRVVTIGTPHRGTWLARFGVGKNARQMQIGSEWNAALDPAGPSDLYSLFTCWYSNCDNIVFPVSGATLPGADNRLVPGAAHIQLAFMPEVMDETFAMLTP